MYEAEMEANVRRGMAFCMATDPEWLDSIDVDSLSIADECKCIVGMKYGSFSLGLRTIHQIEGDAWDSLKPPKRTIIWAFMHGFHAGSQSYFDGDFYLYTEGCKLLTATWRRLILEAREQRKPSVAHDQLDEAREHQLANAN